MTVRVHNLAFALAAMLLAAPLFAQTAPPAERVVRMSGAAPASAGQQTAIHFAIYDANEGGKLLWKETQIVAVDASGQYTAFLGAMSADGLPLEVFAGGAARWLAVEGPNGPLGARTLLAAVPYAVSAATAANASALAGRPATDFQLTPAARQKDAVAAGDTSAAATTPLVNNGSANFIGKFFNNVDLINSQLFDNGSGVGLGTTSPLDKLHVQFTNNAGSLTGYAVQNLSGGVNAYSGMLFYDQNGALGQFQGFNNSTHEYRINNIASNGSINFMTASASRFKVVNDGSIGLSSGTRVPSLRLENYGTSQSDVTFISYRHTGTISSPTATGIATNLFRFEGAGHDGTNFTSARGYLQIVSSETWNSTANGTEINFATTPNGSTVPLVRVSIDNGGNVGIGTSSPARAKLDIVGTGGSFSYGTRGILNTTGATTSGTAGTTTNNSIFADGFIWSEATFAISDARIKKVKGRSNGAADLATLMNVKITDYSFVDTIARGDGVQKKVIAQELEEVYPQAVRRTRDVVPDIFKLATMTEGWIVLSTDLKKGDRVRLHVGDSAKIHEVLEVGNGRFRTELAEADGTKVFVYGREVDDFRAVDYEAVSMLGVSATQELARRLEQQTAETAALKQELAEMRTALTAALEAVAAAKVQQR